MHNIIISILIAIFLASFIGGIATISGYGFLLPFGIALVGQVMITFLFNVGLRAWCQLQVNKLEILRLNAMDKNTAVVYCETCKEPHEINIDITGGNDYRCEKCGTLNTVLVSLNNVQKTEIIPNGPLTQDIVDQFTSKNESPTE